MTELRVTRVKALVRVPLLVRLKLWWMRRRIGAAGRAVLDAHSLALDEALLYGRQP